MKFSVLLPTRNRLELLRFAVESVLRQDYQDWEIVISDNHSDQDIAGYVRSLADDRIRYHRTEAFVPVTENWNNALERSAGEYVIMLGDDDCLMKGYFRTVHGLLERYGSPDFIYSRGYLYAYPGVMPGQPEGYLQPHGCARFLKSSDEPFFMDRTQAHRLVSQSMNFWMPFDYNMQYSTVSRRFIDSLKDKGPFFQSSYPDYYASNVLFLAAERILICPYRLVTIGISPKSFGFFYFNEAEKDGVEFLNNLPDADSVRRVREVLLPGTDMNTFWLLAMETITLNYGARFGLRVNYRRYRFLQLMSIYRQRYFTKTLSREQWLDFHRRLHLGERLLYGSTYRLAAMTWARVPETVRTRVAGIVSRVAGHYPAPERDERATGYRNILEVFESIGPVRPCAPDERPSARGRTTAGGGS